MFTALALSLALGAPVPSSTPPVASGPAPQVMELKADANGKITITVMRTTTQKLVGGATAAGNAGGAVPREVTVNKPQVVEIGDVKDLTITTADGKKVDKVEAMKKLAPGATVVISSDGKPVSPIFLKVFKDDTLVLTSPELGKTNAPNMPLGGAGGGIRPVPVPGGAAPGAAPGAKPIQIQGNGGAIQIQVAPGGLVPVVPPAPVPEK